MDYQKHSSDTTTTTILRIKQVCTITGLSRTTIWRHIREGKFPAPVRLGPNAIGWFSHEIHDYLCSLPRTTVTTQD